VDKPFSWPSDIFYLFASPAFTYRVGRKADSTDSTVIDHNDYDYKMEVFVQPWETSIWGYTTYAYIWLRAADKLYV
jgi:hypothetical protein